MKISSGTLQSKSLQEASPTLVGKEDYKTETSVLYSYKDSALPASSAIKNGETTKLDYKPFSKEFSPQDTNEVILEWWIGEVDKVYNDYFSAYMIDLKGKEIGAEFDMNSVDPNSRELLKPRAQFAYYVSRIDSIKGRRTASALVFSKPFRLSYESKEALLKRAEELFGPEPIFDEE